MARISAKKNKTASRMSISIKATHRYGIAWRRGWRSSMARRHQRGASAAMAANAA